MPVEHDRIRRDLAMIATFTATPGHGATRPTFSPAWRDACDYLKRELASLGCKVRVDAAGNLHARPPGLAWETPAWASGSHLDSVPNGGDYDGVAGVVVPLELLRAAHEAGIDDFPLELIMFAEEEGPTFGLGMLGSRALVGKLGTAELAALTNSDGDSYLEAGRPHGVVAERIGTDLLQPATLRGFIEVHAEQGPGLWKNQCPLAIVEAIAGRHQFRCRFTGTANHAGSTAMPDRADALAGAAEAIVRLEALAAELSPHAVITVGRIECRPNAINVIPETVDFTIDFRAPADAVLEHGNRRIAESLDHISRRRGLGLDLACTEAIPAIALDQGICGALDRSAASAGCGALPRAVSGALHDSAVLAPHVPTAMLFIASRDGISHNPAEFSRTEDITAAAAILWNFIRES